MSRMGDAAIDQLNAMPEIDRRHFVIEEISSSGQVMEATAFETLEAACTWAMHTKSKLHSYTCACGNFHAHTDNA